MGLTLDSSSYCRRNGCSRGTQSASCGMTVLRTIGCTREDCAGFAADAYARVNGMGALCVTYCVGGLSVCNSIAGAYAEKSPLVVISGAPGLGERDCLRDCAMECSLRRPAIPHGCAFLMARTLSLMTISTR